MFKKCIWVLGFTWVMLVDGNSSQKALRDTSVLRLLNKHISGVHAPRTQWTYRPQEESHSQTFEGISHGSTLKVTESSHKRPDGSGSSQEYWWPSPDWQNFTNYYGYSKPSYEYSAVQNGATGFYFKDPAGKIHSRYPYQQMRPVTYSQSAFKKFPSNYLKEKLHIPSYDASGKPKYKKTVLHQPPSDYKKIEFSSVTKPYHKHKHSSQNHPHYRRYFYQSPYQRYAILSSEIFRHKDMSPSGDYYKTSTASPNQDPGRRYTTERMDDTYPDGSANWEDYSAYNDTNHKTNGNYYEDTYEEVEKTTLSPEESFGEEGTTRGYYGDRIYMSTHVPLVTSDKTGVKNKYFIIRRTFHDDDTETLFE